jgi:RNA-directed DNA polymerase
MHPVDLSLSKACKNKKVDYTRYADDLTFSGVDARSILPFARDVISSLGYEFDKKKTNIFRKGRRQLVTGLVVNKKPNMAKPLRKRLRAAVHARINNKSIHWGGEVMSDEELLGRIAFLFQTQPQEAIRLRTRLKGVIGAN